MPDERRDLLSNQGAFVTGYQSQGLFVQYEEYRLGIYPCSSQPKYLNTLRACGFRSNELSVRMSSVLRSGIEAGLFRSHVQRAVPPLFSPISGASRWQVWPVDCARHVTPEGHLSTESTKQSFQSLFQSPVHRSRAGYPFPGDCSRIAVLHRARTGRIMDQVSPKPVPPDLPVSPLSDAPTAPFLVLFSSLRSSSPPHLRPRTTS